MPYRDEICQLAGNGTLRFRAASSIKGWVNEVILELLAWSALKLTEVITQLITEQHVRICRKEI
jgi:hypothetical protein